MRGHDQTSGRGRLGAWSWIVVVASAMAVQVRAQDPATPEMATSPAEPVDLAAQTVSDWTDGAAHWVILEGKAAVLQGGDGVRADRAVVRIRPDVDPESRRFHLDVYAEGEVRESERPNLVQRRWRRTLTTSEGPTLKPYSTNGLRHYQGPPSHLGALVRRGFPSPSPTVAAAPSPSNSVPGPPPVTETPRDVPQASRPAMPATRPSPAQVVPRPDSRASGEEPEATLPTLIATVAPVSASARKDSTEVEPVPAETPPPPTEVGARTYPNRQDPPPDAARVDGGLKPVQFIDEGFADVPMMPGMPAEDPPVETPAPAEPPPESDLDPLPEGEIRRPRAPAAGAVPGVAVPYSQRSVSIYPRDGGPNFRFDKLETKNGITTIVVRGGVTVHSEDKDHGTLDLSADSVVIWRGGAAEGNNGSFEQDGNQPLEVYLEGNVIFRQDELQVAGNGDQRLYRANQAYYDFRTDRFVGLDAELNMFAAGLIAPMKMTGPRIQHYTPLVAGPDGRTTLGPKKIFSDNAMMTGSRFPSPGYRFFAKSIDMTQVPVTLRDPISGSPAAPANAPNPPQDLTWQIDARQNRYYMGPLPVFYWPRVVTTPEDLDPPLRNITPRFNNYFGQQLLTDWNGFKLFGLQKPKFVQVDTWNIDIDYLSRRKSMALGSEFGYFGTDLLSDIANDFSPDNTQKGYQRKDLFPNIEGKYFGYLDFWGLNDHATDVLGSGPAVITYGPPGLGKKGFQRTSVPLAQNFRGRVLFRHMQSLLGPDADPFEDFRVQFEAAYVSDRNFLEEYYKRLFDIGLDEPTDAYLIKQKDNHAFTALVEANLQNWYTESQWAPKLDYYRLGDSLFGNMFTYYTDTGVDWANTHTAVEVNNPNIFAFIPYDPVSNTSGPLRTGRIYTNQELDMPVDLEWIRLVPYVQGQAVGWDNQIDGRALGRLWGAAGGRVNIMAWKTFPTVDSDLLNVHGLTHKVNFDVDYRDAWSNVPLNRIGVQDNLDDNTYEYVRRYFALTNYAGGLLPPQYDPRHLILRRAISPITGTTDIQASMQTIQLGIHQRLQTKRGPEGRRRVTDYMVLDLTSTYFPQARRDNFGKSFGQNMYNWEWYIGDRTSIYSNGWFEFFDINGQALLKTNPNRRNDPFGITVVSSGIAINRPPRGSMVFGYSIVNTGTIATSAMNVMYTYWLSPKWYGAFSTSYDFGNAVWLGSLFTITRIGADYLTSVGVAVDPQRNSYTFGFELAPRLSPNIRLGSTAGLLRFDSRFAPTQ